MPARRSLPTLLKTSTFRLAAVYLLVFALSAGAILAYVYWNAAVLLEEQAQETIGAEIQGLAEQYRLRGLVGVMDTVSERSTDETGALYLFSNSMGRRLAGNLSSLPVDALEGSGWIEFPHVVEVGGRPRKHIVRAFHTELNGGYRLVVGRDIEELRQFSSVIRSSILWALAGALVMGVGGGLVMSRNFLHRIDQISDTSRAIMAGDLAERVPVSGTGDEIDRLAVALNEMLDQIERLMTGMREVSSNVAHDLKTPLTRLRARAENALRSDSKEEYRAALGQTMDEADRLLATFNALLSIARAEAGQAREGIQPLDAAGLVRDMAELFEPLVEDAGGEMDVAADGPAMVRADRQLLAQALSNLLDNAMKYGAVDGVGPVLRVAAETTGEEVILTVADRGPGIAESEREHVKERFVRLDESRSRPGSGLGLSLADSVAKLLGGRLVLDDNQPGLRARLVLPRLAAA